MRSSTDSIPSEAHLPANAHSVALVAIEHGRRGWKGQTKTLSESQAILCLGYLKKPWGVLGEIKIKSYGELLSQHKKNEKLHLYSSAQPMDGMLKNSEYRGNVIIESIKSHQEGYLLKLSGVENKEEAQEYCHLFVGLSVKEAKKKFGGSRESYLFEYLNLKVVDQETNAMLGEIIRIEELNQKTMLIVRLSENDTEIMLPALSPYIKKKDIAEEVIYTEKLYELQDQCNYALS